MVYVTVWSEFVEKSLELYCAQPSKTRYTLKYRGSDNEIVLKVTDDTQVIQYRTTQSNELKLTEQWNYIMLKLATTKNPDAAKIAAEIEAEREQNKAKKAPTRKTKQ